MNIEWNATNYTNHFSFVHKYGEDVLKLIDAPAGSRVLDLGCGNGALTKKLQELGFQAQGMDASLEMLHVARQNYPDIRFEKGDATQFTLQDPVDVIFSNAVFHWIDAEKQDALAAHIASALKPGGTLVCEFGGKNCAESVHAVLEQCFTARGLHYPRINYFPTIAEYTAILERNGLRPDYAVLFDPSLAIKEKICYGTGRECDERIQIRYDSNGVAFFCQLFAGVHRRRQQFFGFASGKRPEDCGN